MIYRLIYSTVAMIAFAGLARAQCANGVCSLASRPSRVPAVQSVPQAVARVATAPVRVVASAPVVRRVTRPSRVRR